MRARWFAVIAVAFTALAFAQVAHAAPAVGVVRGVVTFTGTPPVREKLVRDSDPVCAKTERLAEDVIVTDGKLKDVLVRIKVGTAGTFAPPAEPVVIAQSQCMYTPRVVGVMAGQKIAVHNGDPTYHNVRGTLGTRTLWNQSQPADADDLIRDTPGKAGDVVSLHCDVHAWMQSWVVVLDHPFFAVTGDDGSFEIKGLPPGTYTLEAWHPTLGLKSTRIKIGKGKRATVTTKFAFAAAPAPATK